MNKIIFSTIFSIVVFSSGIAASSENYMGVDFTIVKYEETGYSDVNPKVLRLRAGHNFTPNFSLEGHIGFGIADDSTSIMGFKADMEIDYLYGLYVRGNVPLSDQFKMYGIAGYTNINATASLLGFSYSDDEEDFSYGVGIEIFSDKKVSCNLEYMQLTEKSDNEFSSISIGAKINF